MAEYRIDDPGFFPLPPDFRGYQQQVTSGPAFPLNTGIDFNALYGLNNLARGQLPTFLGPRAPEVPIGGPGPRGGPPPMRAPEVPIGGPGPGYRGPVYGIEPWLGQDPRYRQPLMGIEPWLGNDPRYRGGYRGNTLPNSALPTILALLQRAFAGRA